MRYILAVLFVSVCIPTQGQWTPKHDAAWWNQQTDAYKLGYLTGYEAAYPSIQGHCVAEKVAMEICYRIAPTFVLGLDEKETLARIDSFYKEQGNQDVTIELVLVLVSEDIGAEAKSKYDHSQSLNRLRELSKPKPK